MSPAHPPRSAGRLKARAGIAILGPRDALLLILVPLPEWRAAADLAGWPIERELLPHRWDKTKVVELFWTKPEGNGPFPALLFILNPAVDSRRGDNLRPGLQP